MLCISHVAIVCSPCPVCLSLAVAIVQQKAAATLNERLSFSLERMQQHFTGWVAATDVGEGCDSLGSMSLSWLGESAACLRPA